VAVLGNLPSWFDVEFTQTAAAVISVALVVVLLIVMIRVRSLGVRIVAVVLVGSAVFGLMHYRSVLKDCDTNGCECKLFGEDLKGGACSQ